MTLASNLQGMAVGPFLRRSEGEQRRDQAAAGEPHVGWHMPAYRIPHGRREDARRQCTLHGDRCTLHVGSSITVANARDDPVKAVETIYEPH